jgi:hypothetical protein
LQVEELTSAVKSRDGVIATLRTAVDAAEADAGRHLLSWLAIRCGARGETLYILFY